LLPIAPKQLKPKLPIFRSLRENEKESKLKQKRNYDRKHRARLLTKVKTNDKVWIKDQKKSGTVKTESTLVGCVKKKSTLYEIFIFFRFLIKKLLLLVD
jgi:hypothetical protein